MALRGGILALVYAFGLGLPFVLVGVGFNRATGTLALLKRHGRRLQLLGGGMLIVVGAAIATGLWNWIILQLRPMITGFTPPI